MLKNKLTQFTYILILILLLLQVYFSSGRATDGDKLAQIDDQLNSINLENDLFQNQIYSQTSISNVQSFALDHHMVPATVANLGSAAVASLINRP